MIFLDIAYNILMYFLAIVAILIVIFLVVILPIIIIIKYTPKKKWYRINYKFGMCNYYYVVKAKNSQQAEIKFRTKSYYGEYPIISIEEIEVEQ
jgi:hypothetical protein